MRLLIADDEEYTREGLMESIRWKEYGINEIKQARDGMEALEISLAFKPDIVLTDIKMPKLSGIEFAEKLVKQCPESKILFMSAFLELDYYKSAIQLSAVDFIEKPINITTVENAIKKAIVFINEKKKQYISNLEKKELQMQKLAGMLHYKNKDKEAIYRICEEVEYPINGNYIAVAVWDKERIFFEEGNVSKLNTFWNQHNVRSICTYIEAGKYLVILKLSERETKKIYFLCKKLIEQVKNFCIGVGSVVESLLDVSESYEMATLNISRSFYDLERRLFVLDDKLTTLHSVDPSLYAEFSSVMRNEPKRLLQWLEQLFQKFYDMKCYRKENVQALVLTFAKAILQEKKSIITKLQNIYSEDDVEQFILRSTSIFQLKDFILNLAQEYQREVEDGVRYSKLIRDVMDYVNAHFSEADLGIEDIAKYMHFSSAHLSVLFKHETGVTIKQYIGDYRLELSKKMLANEHYKINEIAELCGYSNANYFAKVFRLATSLSPVEYRKNCGIILT